MEGYPKNNVTLGQDHGCACGSSCTCGKNCTCGPSETLEAEIYDFSLSSRASPEFIEAEEKERQERIASGVDPLVYGKLFRCQTELMHRGVSTSLLNDARARVLSVKGSSRGLTESIGEKISGMRASFSTMAHNIVETIKTKEADLESRSKPIIDDLYSQSQVFAVATNQNVENLKWTSASIAQDTGKKVEEAKESMIKSAESVGLRASGTLEEVKTQFNMGNPSSRAAEEKERARRMSDTVDPMAAARLGRVQAELINSVQSN